MKATELIVKCLENEGVGYIFGVPGEVNMDLLDALLSSPIRFVMTRHEQGAAFMADVYGRLTGKAGVCLATLGPGATNLITGLADANMDRAPVVALTAQGQGRLLVHASRVVGVSLSPELCIITQPRLGTTDDFVLFEQVVGFLHAHDVAVLRLNLRCPVRWIIKGRRLPLLLCHECLVFWIRSYLAEGYRRCGLRLPPNVIVGHHGVIDTPRGSAREPRRRCHSQDQLAHFSRRGRSARRPLGAAIVFPGNQPLMPIQEHARVTMATISLSRCRAIYLAVLASLRRWSSLNRGFLPSRSLRTLPSSWRYSMTFCWLRLSQPARQMRMN